ncbi:hypothetical protein [Bacillus sp. XF8]|uniref:hypothetical protein n=1 Tax=Bacillus sp. XF8 TaxID=2819289 RepID=UPI001AA08DD6|nr:hypothetical protein [Bacillus sp. XF8]MBO1578668.1 hypothetical protein [Bacillus sp. XF8]
MKIVSDLLTILKDGEHISPKYISRTSRIPKETTITLLMELKNRDLIDVSFIINCTNEDLDLIHSFEFKTDEQLIEFIKKQEDKCPDCEATLKTTDVRVAFIKKILSIEGEGHG